jgi:hypothetical protein
MDPMQPPKLPHPGIYLTPPIDEFVNIASERNPQLKQHKDYIFSIIPLNDV